MRRFWIVSILVSLISFSGCGSRYFLNRDDILSDDSRHFSKGGSDTVGAVDNRGYNGSLSIIWQQESSGKPVGSMTIANGVLTYPETKKKIRFYNLETGKKLGRIKTKGIPQTGFIQSDSIGFFALSPRRNVLYAMDLVRHKTLWRRNVKDARQGPIIVDNRLLVSTGGGSLYALAVENGDLKWQFDAEEGFTTSASYANGRLFQPADRGKLYVLSSDSGRELYQLDLEGPTAGIVTIGANVYVTDVLGNVTALDETDGRLLWQTDAGGSIWGSATYYDDHLFVGHSGGEIVAFDASDGKIIWRYHTGEVIKASPLVVGDYLIVGTLAGNILVLDAGSGVVIASEKLEGAIEFPPISDGRRLYVATQAGKIVCFGESRKSGESNERPQKTNK